MRVVPVLLLVFAALGSGAIHQRSGAAVFVTVENGGVMAVASRVPAPGLGTENRRIGPDTAAAGVGLYFDPGYNRSRIDSPPFGSPFRAWLVLKGVTSAKQWYARVIFPSGISVLSAVLKPPGSFNAGSINNWIVTLPSCTAPDSNGSLLVVEYLLRIDGLCLEDSTCGGQLCQIQITSTVSPLRLPGWVDCASVFHSTQYQDQGELGGCATSGDPPYFIGTPGGSPNSGPVPLSVQFSAPAFDFDPIQYYWYFGDGAFMTGVGASSPQHTFTDPGPYLVWVNVFDGDNDRSAYIPVNAKVSAVGDPRPAGKPRILTAQANPFGSSTTLVFEMQHAIRVDLRIYDTGGRLVRTVLSEWKSAGQHSEIWNRLDESGRRAPAGIYVVRISAGTVSESLRLVAID